MSRRWVLVPMVMTLAFVGGCRASDDGAADNGPPPVQTAAAAPVETSPPPPPPPAKPSPAKPGPTVTVRARPAPAPYFPLDLPPSDVAASADPFPREVTEFMVARDGCDHFRGEEPTDAERRAYIDENVAELCKGTDAKLAMLRRRYADDPSVIAALKAYEDRIEAPARY